MQTDTPLAESLSTLLGDPSVRAEHARRFLEHGLPTVRDENWKYTSLRSLDRVELTTTPPETMALAAEDLAGFELPIPSAWRITLVNGRFSAELSFLDGLPADCRVAPLSELADLPGWAEAALDEAFDSADLALASLNGAMAREGLLVELADGVVLDRPLHLLSLSLEDGSARLVNLRHLVRLGAGAACTLIDHIVAAGDPGHVNNVVVQAELADGARLDHIRLQTESDHGHLVTRSRIRQRANSRYRYWGFDLGGKLVRHDLEAELRGEGAHCSLSGVYALDGQRHVDNHTRVDHISPNATSSEVFKGVLDGRSRGVFNGKVVVHPGADGTDAQQSNGNLLLSRRAEVDTKPELEIYADDVKCSHGATIGQLDANQLFYLRSRGIEAERARLMLTEAFCRDVVDTVEPESLREFLGAQVLAHLPSEIRTDDDA